MLCKEQQFTYTQADKAEPKYKHIYEGNYQGVCPMRVLGRNGSETKTFGPGMQQYKFISL